MKKIIRFKVFPAMMVLIVSLLLSVAPELAAQGEMKPEIPAWSELSRMVKDIRLPGDSLKSIAVDMHMNLPLPLKLSCFLRYHAPASYSLQIFDGDDQTPVLIICENIALVNDPMADDISLIASAGVTFEFVPRNEQYNANFAFNTPVDGKINDRIELDFVSLFSRITADQAVQKISPHQFMLSGTTEQNSSFSAEINTQEAFPLKKLSMFVAENPVAVLSFPRIDVDAAVAERDFVFPLQQLNDSGLQIKQSSPQGIIDTMVVVTTVIKAVFARSAIRNPDCRQQVEAMLKTTFDWQGLTAKDAARSAILRKIFPEPTPR